MVHPLWVGVLLPLLTLLIGTCALARRSWAAWVVFVVPILLAMLASSMRRYPFHGRLILELVPAFYLLIALGTERLGDATAGHREAGLQGSAGCAHGLSVSDRREPGRLPISRATAIGTAICTRTFSFNTTSRCQDTAADCRARIARVAIDPARVQNTGMSTRFPPFIADSWAQRPTMVQLADVSASGRGGRSPLRALRKAWTRCGCEPP